MIKPFSLIGSGSSGVGASVSFAPPGGDYTGTVLNVHITVTAPAVKLRWKIDMGPFTTVNALTTIVAVPLDYEGHTLYCDALDSGGNVLATRYDDYARTIPG